MGIDYAEKERVFIASLEEDSGRALDAWMQAIAQMQLTGRNDIIEWLRHQGFTFANASWLERIHHNSGRLIYADGSVHPPTSRNEDEMPPPVPARAPRRCS